MAQPAFSLHLPPEPELQTVPAVRNVMACLVHERPECILDMVRNLRHLDPASIILLYNGGHDPSLLSHLHLEQYGVIVHPKSRPMAWGRLHEFALDSMRFALDNIPFDTLTIVDSDQLALRPGYSTHLAHCTKSLERVGVLSSLPVRQDHRTRIAPVKVAWREYELWRPFLKKFPDGEQKFVHWTFWPATVFMADAARDLVRLFDVNKELQSIMERTQIWATEEVLLPTLVALLGYSVAANPCCGDWVQFRTRYSQARLRAALARPDAYWMHPVPRQLDNELRSGIRTHFSHYSVGPAAVKPSEVSPAGNIERNPVLLAWPIVAQMKWVEGWLDEHEADLLIAISAELLRTKTLPQAIVEIGSYCGRSTVVFGGVIKSFGGEARIYSIDPHDGRLGALDGAITSVPPSRKKFQHAIDAAGMSRLVEPIQAYARDVTWDKPIGLLFIDHLHDYASVSGDFLHFERWVSQYGYVVFHDYADYFPGVKTFVEELVATGHYRKAQQVRTMVALQKVSTDALTLIRSSRADQQLRAHQRRIAPTVVREASARSSEPLRALAQFRDKHQGETVVVCGCGESLNEFTDPNAFVTIGVNDVGRRFHPKYLVVVNPPQQFTRDRWPHVQKSESEYLFTQLDLGPVQPSVVRFNLGKLGGVDFSNPEVLHFTQNSPYVALCLAVHMGAKRIGLIGVDFTQHHFFAKTGTHPLNRQFATIDAQYRRLNDALQARGIEVFNLSSTSRLTAFPKLNLKEFAGVANAEKTLVDTRVLNIVSYATTPVAGVPAILARCINARTAHSARCVWATNEYGNGVRFEGDVQWTKSSKEAAALLAAADLVIVHNGKTDPAHRQLLANKPVITLAHNYMWNVDRQFVERGLPGAVVGQYQATLPEFHDWIPVPNPMPWWESEHQPEVKPPIITIAYTPSGKHERYALGHSLYWHSKGYDTTLRVMERLANRFGVRLQVVRDRQVSHAEALLMKRTAHIVIDECVTGSYHRNSLEGLAAGCVVVNGIGLLAGVPELLRSMSMDTEQVPFVSADLDRLESVLVGLIERGCDVLSAQGRANRQWVEQHWEFGRQWEHFWMPLVNRALEARGASRPALHFRPVDSLMNVERVSAIIPHGGADRLPHLASTLEKLRACESVAEIIVAEMGSAPLAHDMAQRFGAKHVFISNTQEFERARCLNTGSALAECEYVLWIDNDLLVPRDFVTKAVKELLSRKLDFLIPYTCIHYLDEHDSQLVLTGFNDFPSYRAAKVLRSGEINGGAGLVRTSFLRQYGAMDERFRGWGGEDNAWLHKARLLGKTGVTEHRDQHLYHVYHPRSGAHTGSPQAAENPLYGLNLALLQEVRKIREPRDFLRIYPPARHWTCPWGAGKHIAFFFDDPALVGVVASVKKELEDLYGIEVASQQLRFNGRASWWKKQTASAWDAIVLFGSKFALRILNAPDSAVLWQITIAITDPGWTRDERVGFQLERAGAVLHLDEPAVEEINPHRTLRQLVSSLSLVLGQQSSTTIPCLPVTLDTASQLDSLSSLARTV